STEMAIAHCRMEATPIHDYPIGKSCFSTFAPDCSVGSACKQRNDDEAGLCIASLHQWRFSHCIASIDVCLGVEKQIYDFEMAGERCLVQRAVEGCYRSVRVSYEKLADFKKS